MIIFAQLPIAGLSRGRRRMPTLALFGLLWAAAWLLVPIAGAAGGQTAFLLLVVVMAVFAIGMCLHGAVAAPLVADLAQPHVLGRYMALNALSWQIGFALGPALGGAGLARLADRRLARRVGAVRCSARCSRSSSRASCRSGTRRTPAAAPASA